LPDHAQGIPQGVFVAAMAISETVILLGMLPVFEDQFIDGQQWFVGCLFRRGKLACASQLLSEVTLVQFVAFRRVVRPKKMIFPVESNAGLTRGMYAVVGDAWFARHCDAPPGFWESFRFLANEPRRPTRARLL
jgi:hypothetical protein